MARGKAAATLSVSIVAATRKFMRKMKRAIARVKEFGASVRRVGKKLLGFGAAFGAIAVGGITLAINKATEFIDRTVKIGRGIGAAQKDVAALEHAFELAGLSGEQAGRAIQVTMRRVGQALDPESTEESTKAFRELGFSIEKLEPLSEKPVEAFKAILDALKDIPNKARRSALAADIFGRAGLQMGNLIEGGSKEITKAQKEVKIFGLALTKKQTKRFEDFADAVHRIKQSVLGLAISFALVAIPDLIPVLNKFREFLSSVDTHESIMEFWVAIRENVRAVPGFLEASLGLVDAIVQSVGVLAKKLEAIRSHPLFLLGSGLVKAGVGGAAFVGGLGESVIGGALDPSLAKGRGPVAQFAERMSMSAMEDFGEMLDSSEEIKRIRDASEQTAKALNRGAAGGFAVAS